MLTQYNKYEQTKYVFDIAIYICNGISTTLLYSVLAGFFGMILGAGLAIIRSYKNQVLQKIIQWYISIIRGTPFLLQLFFIYFALPTILKINISVFIAGVLALSINSSAYVSEIFRGGFNSIDRGQFEAARSLSIPYFKMMFDIILPQSLRSIFPSLINELVNITKESAVIGVIGANDLMRKAQIVATEKYEFVTPLCITAILYYIIIYIITYCGTLIEKKVR